MWNPPLLDFDGTFPILYSCPLVLLTRMLSKKKRVLLLGILKLELGHSRQPQRQEEVSCWIRANMGLPFCRISAGEHTWMNKNIEELI